MFGIPALSSSRVLLFSSAVEIATGLGFLIAPSLLLSLLLGMEGSTAVVMIARFFGIAVLSLGLACWPGAENQSHGAPPLRAMLVYNVAAALYLAYLGAIDGVLGPLLWPGAVLHAIVAVLLGIGYLSGQTAAA
jgi:hypothetical protein